MLFKNIETNAEASLKRSRLMFIFKPSKSFYRTIQKVSKNKFKSKRLKEASALKLNIGLLFYIVFRIA